jgi:hydroxymethylglutaryl-CoA synthase
MIAKKLTSVGIEGVGFYLPRGRLAGDQIAAFWHQDSHQIASSLGIKQKSVAFWDEDCLTMSVEASQEALAMAKLKQSAIGAVLIGSESHPYIVKPTGTILADILNIKDSYICCDLQFACKAATTGIQLVAGLIESGIIDHGLVVGSDKAQARPGDILEYTSAAGAVALVLGNDKKKWLAQLHSTDSYNTDTPDFWRNSRFPSHSGRFTGEPGYFAHINKNVTSFLKKINKKISFFNHVVFHMPNAKFPYKIAKELKVTPQQLQAGFIVPDIGNPYTASSLFGLVSTLREAKEKENILMASYGSGAGSDVFWWEVKSKPKIKPLTTGGNIKEMQYTDYLINYDLVIT